MTLLKNKLRSLFKHAELFEKSHSGFFFPVMLSLLIVSCKKQQIESRLVKTINTEWTFNYFPEEIPDSSFTNCSFDDSNWQAVAIPHTWSTYETTGEVHPFIYNASERDDSYWWYGWGYYRKKFSIDHSLKDKKVFVEFDGVQKYSKVFLNGMYLGDHMGGFTSFYFDLTEKINWEGENVLTVLVSNRRNDENQIPPMTAGNWNVYGGIYRDVRLVVKNKIYIPFQGSYKHEGGTYITTPVITKGKAQVSVHTWVKNEQQKAKVIELSTAIIAPNGNEISCLIEKGEIQSGDLKEFNQLFDDIQNPLLWSPKSPNLYCVLTRVLVDGILVDDFQSPLGFRHYYWDYKNNELYLNGEKMNILGTNRHQEYPWLGDAIPKWISRMDMVDIRCNLGHNFMRLAHYPNDKYLYQLADSFGIVIVEEVPNIKSIDFNEIVQEQNVKEMIRRDRNHPCILFWSMGNETTDAADSKWAIEEDSTRIIHLRKGERAGDFVKHTHENLDMENLLRVTIRGWFDVADSPLKETSRPEDGQYSSNETWQHKMARVKAGSVRGLLGVNCVSWLYADHGADREYLNCILKHINPKGWVDMYRQPKYIYWLTKAYYTDIPIVFIHSHFWRTDYLNQKKNIQIDSNCDEVELFVNGKSIGIKYPARETFNTITFNNVIVEKGSLKAIGKKNGKEYIHLVEMPRKSTKIVLTTDQSQIKSDRSGIALIKADILDEYGHRVFDATNTLNWSISGPGKLIGPGRYESDIYKHESERGTGYTVVPIVNLVRSTNIPGKIKVTVTSEGLEAGEIYVQSIKPIDKADWLKEFQLSDKNRSRIKRTSDYVDRITKIPLIILPLAEDHIIKGYTVEEFRSAISSFISERNYGNYTSYSAYSYLVDALVRNLKNSNSILVADDYNFLVNNFNMLALLEDFLEKSAIPCPEKNKLKEKYAMKVLINGSQIDINEIIRHLGVKN